MGPCSPAVEADPWSLWPLFLFLDPDEALHYEAWSLALWKVPGDTSQKGRVLTLCGWTLFSERQEKGGCQQVNSLSTHPLIDDFEAWFFGSAYLGVFHVAKKLAVSSWSNSRHHNIRPCATSHPPVTHFTVSQSHSLRLPFPGSHQHLILALGSVWKRTWTKSHCTALLYLKKTSGPAPADTFCPLPDVPYSHPLVNQQNNWQVSELLLFSQHRLTTSALSSAWTVLP